MCQYGCLFITVLYFQHAHPHRRRPPKPRQHLLLQRSHAMDKSHSQTCPLKAKYQWCAFCEMENVYNQTRNVRSYSPNNMVNHLKVFFKKFKLGRQEDAHEFLRYLIQGMQQTETGKLGKDRNENQSKIKSTRIFSVFGGIIKTCVDCLNCNHRSLTSQRYYDFNIRKECQRSNTLLEGLSSFFTIDKLQGANKYLCDHCKTLSNARKRFLLQTTPPVATFQFKRFTNLMRKIGKFIQYPMTIDLGKYMQIGRKVVYKLFGVVVHAGGAAWSGHYYAFVRRGENWFKMDDSYVSKVSQESAMGQNAYLLFYQKVFEDNLKVVSQINSVSVAVVNGSVNQLKPEQKLRQQQQIVKNGKDKVQANRNKAQKQEKQSKTNDFLKKINGVSSQKQLNQLKTVVQTKSTAENTSLVQLKPAPITRSTAVTNPTPIPKQDIQTQNQNQNPNQNSKKDLSPQKIIQDIQAFTHKKLTQQQILALQKIINPQSDQQSLAVPQSLVRRKSKQQAQNSMTYAQLIRHTAEKILQLSSKIRGKRPRNNAARLTYDVRKYEIVMQKKRKLG